MSHLKKHKTLWLGLRLLLASVIVFFLARTIYTRWSQITAFPWQFHIIPLAGSMILQIVAAILWATVWRHMAIRSDCQIRWRDGVRIYLISNLAKYIPGSIWGYVGRAYLGKGKGLTVPGVGISVVWEIGTAIVASLLLTSLTVPFYPNKLPASVFLLVLIAAITSFVVLLPPISNRWVRLLNKQFTSSFRWRDLLLYISAAFATHVLVGTGFFLFTRSLVDVDTTAWWSFVGMWSFSATAGLVIILVPYGLGVKEGLLTLLLQPFLPTESASLIALASRLWTIGSELLIVLLIAIVSLTEKAVKRQLNNPQ